MTEKLTYDPTPADAPEFTEDEQNSLEVAEKLGQEEAELYAGKFENAEELENAYLELQKKLGSRDEDDDEVEDTTLDEDEYPEEVADGVNLITQASEEYFENEGAISEETMERFKEMSSSELVEAYMAIRDRNPDVDGGGYSADLTDAEMNQVYNSAGGEAEYNNLTSWAAQNLDESKMDAFNDIIDRGNATSIQIAVAGLRAEYENQEGYEGRMLTGKAARSSGDVFRSQAEVVQAMNNPKYDRDPAYRQDVYDKLERSNVQF
tara:strand:- start:317 stop:1108 length:792 start_codon:yes stop_codon:yes gene_type:complete